MPRWISPLIHNLSILDTLFFKLEFNMTFSPRFNQSSLIESCLCYNDTFDIMQALLHNKEIIAPVACATSIYIQARNEIP